MPNFKACIGPVVGCVLALAGVVSPQVVHAAGGDAYQLDGTSAEIVLATGTGRVVPLPSEAGSMFSADSKIAEVRPASTRSMFVFGVASGDTTIEVTSTEGAVIARYMVRIVPSNYNASVMRQNYGDVSPGVRIRSSPGGLDLEGQAHDSQDAQKLIDHAKTLAGKDGTVSDYMTVPGAIQVNVRVRIVEMSRTLVRQLGVEWGAVNSLGTSAMIGVMTGSTGAAALTALQNTSNSIGFLSHFKVGSQPITMDTIVDALAQDNLVHSLADPNLTTISGQPASFLAGGEYPVPVSSFGGANVTYRQYGIGLSFVPTVLAGGRINMHVKPEVSALTSAGEVTIQGTTIPALTMRRADTTVELASGQSMVLAGLLSDNTQITTNGLPWLGDIPVLGALFKSSDFQKQETELVIIATPYIVRPVDHITDLHAPDEGWTTPNDIERMFLMRQSGRDVRKRRPWQGMDAGDAGFMVE